MIEFYYFEWLPLGNPAINYISFASIVHIGHADVEFNLVVELLLLKS